MADTVTQSGILPPYKSQITHFPNHSLFRKPLFCSKTLQGFPLPTVYTPFTFSNQDPIFLSVLISPNHKSPHHPMALWQLVHSPCLYSVCPLCLECHLPIFQCPNAPCLLRYTAQCHFPQEAFPDLRSEYYFRAHLHPVQPSGKVLTTLHHNDGGSIGRDQLYILRTAHQLPLYSQAD